MMNGGENNLEKLLKVGDVAEIVMLDITTAEIGEYSSVRILEVNGTDILVADAEGNEVWVTVDHIELVND